MVRSLLTHCECKWNRSISAQFPDLGGSGNYHTWSYCIDTGQWKLLPDYNSTDRIQPLAVIVEDDQEDGEPSLFVFGGFTDIRFWSIFFFQQYNFQLSCNNFPHYLLKSLIRVCLKKPEANQEG